jgi:hypothetical protein
MAVVAAEEEGSTKLHSLPQEPCGTDAGIKRVAERPSAGPQGSSPEQP